MLVYMMGSEFTYVFEWPSLFHQVSQRMLHYTGRPLVHFTLVIICSANNTFNTLRQNHTQRKSCTLTSHQRVVIKYSSFMYPGIKRYLFNCDIDLISTEDNLQENKKKEKIQLFCDICVVLLPFLKPPYRLKVYIVN